MKRVLILLFLAGCASSKPKMESSVQASAPDSERAELVLSSPRAAPVLSALKAPSPWTTLPNGMSAAAFVPNFETEDFELHYVPIAEGIASGKALIVVRADPRKTPPVLLNKSQLGFTGPVTEVARENGLAAAVNASMYGTDYLTSIGYMRNYGHLNHPNYSSRLKAFLVFNPKSAASRPVQIVEKTQSNWKIELAKYDTVIETYRMITRKGENQWKPDTAYYYQVALAGLDRAGRILFFFYPPRIDMYSLNEYIKSLPLDLDGLLYLDGDSKGAMYLSSETGLSAVGYDGPLPNILGVKASP